MISNNEKDLSNFSMLDLFRSEMEVHAATLNDGLLSLENTQGASSGNDMIEAMMRAAHSIKGGARIVELDHAVKLAHTMEDCFVSVQKGEFSLESDHIDILLKGVDMLIRISASADENSSEWLTAHQKEIETLISNISLIHTHSQRSVKTPEVTPKTSGVKTSVKTPEVTPKTSEVSDHSEISKTSEVFADSAEETEDTQNPEDTGLPNIKSAKTPPVPDTFTRHTCKDAKICVPAEPEAADSRCISRKL